MNDYYENVYKKRLNRYGLDFQSRIQGQRERNFEDYLYKTIYRVDFEFEGRMHPGSLEQSKQSYSETEGFLLTRRDLKIPNGTILEIKSLDGAAAHWMVWWLEYVEANGYNKYLVLKMTHTLTWKTNGVECSQMGYLQGPGAKAISDTIKSGSGAPIYKENNNLHLFITSYNKDLVRDVYFEVRQKETRQGYVITEFDVNSTPGVSYVSVDPVQLREENIIPTKTPEDREEDFYWLNGGKIQ